MNSSCHGGHFASPMSDHAQGSCRPYCVLLGLVLVVSGVSNMASSSVFVGACVLLVGATGLCLTWYYYEVEYDVGTGETGTLFIPRLQKLTIDCDKLPGKEREVRLLSAVIRFQKRSADRERSGRNTQADNQRDERGPPFSPSRACVLVRDASARELCETDVRMLCVRGYSGTGGGRRLAGDQFRHNQQNARAPAERRCLRLRPLGLGLETILCLHHPAAGGVRATGKAVTPAGSFCMVSAELLDEGGYSLSLCFCSEKRCRRLSGTALRLSPNSGVCANCFRSETNSGSTVNCSGVARNFSSEVKEVPHYARLRLRGSKFCSRSDVSSTQKTVAPFEFRAGLEIEMKFISNRQYWWFEISIRDQHPSSTNREQCRNTVDSWHMSRSSLVKRHADSFKCGKNWKHCWEKLVLAFASKTTKFEWRGNNNQTCYRPVARTECMVPLQPLPSESRLTYFQRPRRLSAGLLSDLPFPPHIHSGAAPYSLQSSTSALKTSLLRASQISSFITRRMNILLAMLRFALSVLQNQLSGVTELRQRRNSQYQDLHIDIPPPADFFVQESPPPSYEASSFTKPVVTPPPTYSAAVDLTGSPPVWNVPAAVHQTVTPQLPLDDGTASPRAHPTRAAAEEPRHHSSAGRMEMFGRGLESQCGWCEVDMEQCQNVRVEDKGDPRVNPPTGGIVRQDCYVLLTLRGIKPGSPWWYASALSHNIGPRISSSAINDKVRKPQVLESFINKFHETGQVENGNWNTIKVHVLHVVSRFTTTMKAYDLTLVNGETHPVIVADAAFQHVVHCCLQQCLKALHSLSTDLELHKSSCTEVDRFWQLLILWSLRADENGAVPECKGRRNGKSVRKPACQHNSHGQKSRSGSAGNRARFTLGRGNGGGKGYCILLRNQTHAKISFELIELCLGSLNGKFSSAVQDNDDGIICINSQVSVTGGRGISWV
ncbi:hypothetical protein PR048_025221 [Dryococelus australis]|uniref:Uncharacterized protein n=1 Tax=Dryococelus australis TaxID=614101 RepID=A0ABQ9GQU9_9NEOP|nr:hypothetical protein PR048_025221 [Dryococelus australis]